MWSLLRGVALAALTAVLVTVVVTQSGREGSTDVAEAHHLAQTAKQEKRFRPGCQRHYPTKRFYKYARARYTKRSKPLTDGQKKYLKHVRLCLANKKKSRRAKAAQSNMRKKFRARLAYYRLTPYVCSDGTRWAIPCYVVMCESHGSWTAYNGSSGARGPYQFVGWNVPWPVYSQAHRNAHHRMARYLWNDSPSHWVCA